MYINKNSKGFTLIELLVVIGVIGVLSGILYVVIDPQAQRNKAKDGLIKENLSKINHGISNYRSTNLVYPSPAQLVAELGTATQISTSRCLTISGIYTNWTQTDWVNLCGTGTNYSNIFWYIDTASGYIDGCVTTKGYSSGGNGNVKWYAIVDGKIKSTDASNCSNSSPYSCNGTALCKGVHLCRSANWTTCGWVDEN